MSVVFMRAGVDLLVHAVLDGGLFIGRGDQGEHGRELRFRLWCIEGRQSEEM